VTAAAIIRLRDRLRSAAYSSAQQRTGRAPGTATITGKGDGMRDSQWARTLIMVASTMTGAACHHEHGAGATGSVGNSPAAKSTAGAVDPARLAAAAEEPDQWFTPGRDANGSYYSPLADVNAGNVARLGFAWEYKLGTRRGLEATPLVIDGVMYAVGNFGHAYAIDAATGRELWHYDPHVDGQWGRYACCDAVSRGLAVWRGRVYVAALDGYLHAIDAATGHGVWKVDTLPERSPKHPYTVTGAAMIAGEQVIVGSSGADFAGVRGYVGAFDLETGALRWRFYTVPRDPKEGPQDQPHLVKALGTWDPRHRWEAGSGGGTVWDGISYDPALDLVYVGTGNGAPYNIKEDGRHGGDDLYAAAIVAIHARSGELAWYYQTTPGDRWDYDSTQKMIFADLDLGHGVRKVLMQASKNGYYYVLDRATGELLSAYPFAYVNWTKGIDPKTGRPIPNPAAEYADDPKLVFPASSGAHSWQPMSYDPELQRTFIPTMEWPMVYIDLAHRPAGLMEGWFTVNIVIPELYDTEGMKSLYGKLPSLAKLGKGLPPATSRGFLRAFDLRTHKLAWEVPTATSWDGGVLSTAGGIVVQGDAAGFLNVYAAADGRQLAHLELGTGVLAAPMTYRIGGVQYVAVMAGYGGNAINYPLIPETAAFGHDNEGRILAFKLGGGTVPMPPTLREEPFPKPPAREGTAATVGRGEVLYNRFCVRCHSFGRGILPDLRRLSAEKHQIFFDIVLNGALTPAGMGRWDDVLTRKDAEALHAYIVEESWKAYEPKPAH
jgi:quinohemoprotein ethanol dehydrogenase